jgi:beta-lactamase class A
MRALKPTIRRTLAPIDGEIAVAFRALSGPVRPLLINGHTTVHAASTMKVPVMIEVYRQAHEGRFDLDDRIRVDNVFRGLVDGQPYTLSPETDSDEALYDHLGERYPIRTLVRRMIAASSNLATNVLLELVGAEQVTRTMHDYGAEGLRVRRGVEDLTAHRQGLDNETSAHDLLMVFERIARRQAVSKTAANEMIDILGQQKHNDMIPARLPNPVTVAHKTGWITGVRHDGGIVFVPNGPSYVLVLLSQNLTEADAVTEAFAQVSRMVFDAVTN